MVIQNGKIEKTTELELFKYYLDRGYDDIISFSDFMKICKENGTKIERIDK